ncbi:MAG: hypothetical protein ABI330_21540 [Caldimonas sp.]
MPLSMQSVEGVNWVGQGGHVIHYPISAGRMVGFTGIVETDEWRASRGPQRARHKSAWIA